MSLSFSGTYAYFHALAAHFWISWERAVLRARVADAASSLDFFIKEAGCIRY